jgi:hypothetical protein
VARIVTGGAAAAGAAAWRCREQEGGEEMTAYTPQELAEGWEFKNLSSSAGAFRTPVFPRIVQDEEQSPGWTFVEECDNGRIRLMRPASARANDSAGALGSDAYSTQVGISEVKLTFCIPAAIFGGLALLGLIVALIAKAGRTPSSRDALDDGRLVHNGASPTASTAAGHSNSTCLDGLELALIMVDGIRLHEFTLVVALGMAFDGTKHVLGLWDAVACGWRRDGSITGSTAPSMSSGSGTARPRTRPS